MCRVQTGEEKVMSLTPQQRQILNRHLLTSNIIPPCGNWKPMPAYYSYRPNHVFLPFSIMDLDQISLGSALVHSLKHFFRKWQIVNICMYKKYNQFTLDSLWKVFILSLLLSLIFIWTDCYGLVCLRFRKDIILGESKEEVYFLH